MRTKRNHSSHFGLLCAVVWLAFVLFPSSAHADARPADERPSWIQLYMGVGFPEVIRLEVDFRVTRWLSFYQSVGDLVGVLHCYETGANVSIPIDPEKPLGDIESYAHSILIQMGAGIHFDTGLGVDLTPDPDVFAPKREPTVSVALGYTYRTRGYHLQFAYGVLLRGSETPDGKTRRVIDSRFMPVARVSYGIRF